MLIRVSARVMQSSHYSEGQIDGAIGSVFGVDHQLILDRTYFLAQHKGQIVGCGGWSKRTTLFGGDAMKTEADTELTPGCDSARIRAFFVHPAWARCGIGLTLFFALAAVFPFKRLAIIASRSRVHDGQLNR